MKRLGPSAFLFLLLVISAFAADPKIESIGPFQGKAPDSVKAALDDTGYRVFGEDGKVLAEIWPAKSAVTAKSDNASAIYPQFVSGAFYGVIALPNGTGDFRGQKIPAGTYTMRYELLPGDGNHMGVAPNPDFFLLVPIDADTDATAKIPYAGLVRLSANASGTAHPAPFALASPESQAVVAKQDGSHTIAYFPIKTTSNPVNIGLILSGSSEE